MYPVEGPIPDDPEKGFLMVATTSYLNILSWQHYHDGVRCTQDDFVTRFESFLRQHGTQEDAWKKLKEENKATT